jgi:putative ABC transport system permease protein
VGAGLMIRSIYSLYKVDPGFRSQNLLSFNVSLPGGRYQPAQAHRFEEQLRERLRALPGAKAAVATSNFYFGGSNYLTFDMEGEPPPPPGGNTPDAQVRSVTHDFHSVMGIPVLQGRGFGVQDGGGAPLVAVVNQTFVKRHYGAKNIIGRRISYNSIGTGDNQQAVWREIVGIIGDVKQRGLDAEVYPEIAVPNAQAPANALTVLVASERDPLLLASAARDQVRALDPALPIYEVETVDHKLAESISTRTFQMYLLAGFAALALLLASVGIYGVMAQAVIQRTPEFGVRMALGAGPGDIRQLVLRYALNMTVVGIAVGTLGAIALSRFLSNALFGISANDPVTFAGVVTLLGSVALLASYIPARRATRVDPVEALRYE